MARAKRNYILIIKINELFFFFHRGVKEMENMFSVFLSSYRNTCKSLENSKKLWKHSPAACVAFFVLSNFYLCFKMWIETWYMLFSFLSTCNFKLVANFYLEMNRPILLVLMFNVMCFLGIMCNNT